MDVKGKIYENFYEDLYLPDLKIRFIEETYEGEESKRTVLYNFRKSARTERKFDKDLCVMNIEEINDVIQGLGYTSESTIRSALSYFSTYVDWCIVNKQRGSHENNINDIAIFSSTQDVTKFMSKIKNTNRYLTKEEIYDLVDGVVNFVDKYMILGIFEGIAGESLYELRSLKTDSDRIDYDNNLVTVEDIDGNLRTVQVTDKLKHIIRYAGSQKDYFLGNGSSSIKVKSRKLVDSDYVLRATGQKGKEDQVLGYDVLSRKFYQLKKYFKTSHRFISPQTVRDSGAIDKVLQWTKEAGLKEPTAEIFDKLKSPQEFNYSDMMVWQFKQKFDHILSLKDFK